MRHILSVIILVLAACAPAPRPATAPHAPATVPSLAEQVVQTQVEAFKRGDIDAFLETYAPDLKMYRRFPSQELMTSGVEQARQRYAAHFAAAAKSPSNLEIPTRIVQGNFVIDHEVFTGLPGGKEFSVVAIYEVREGKIQTVWFIE